MMEFSASGNKTKILADEIIQIALIELVGCKIRFGRTHKVEKRFEGWCRWIVWEGHCKRKGGSFVLLCDYKHLTKQNHKTILKRMLHDYAKHIIELKRSKSKPLTKRRKCYDKCRNMAINSSTDLEIFMNGVWQKFGDYLPNDVRMLDKKATKEWLLHKKQNYKKHSLKNITITNYEINNIRKTFTLSFGDFSNVFFRNSHAGHMYTFLPKIFEYIMKDLFTSSSKTRLENMRDYILIQFICWIYIHPSNISLFEDDDFEIVKTPNNDGDIIRISIPLPIGSTESVYKFLTGSQTPALNVPLCISYYRCFEEDFRKDFKIQKRPKTMFYDTNANFGNKMCGISMSKRIISIINNFMTQ